MSLVARVKSALDIVSTIAMILAAGILIWQLLIKQPAASAPSYRLEDVKGLQIDAAHITNTSGNGRIAIVEFSDFQCPFCGKHARETLPTIKRRLVKSGTIRYVALHYPLEATHPLALRASEAAECAGRQGHFWEMHERLFADAKAALANVDLLRHARLSRLNRARFEECLERDETLGKVHGDQAEGRRLRVTGTPTFFIGTVRSDGGIDLVTRIRGAAPVEIFSRQVAELQSQSRRDSGQ
jgi:protein-disulfide isomerase